MVQLLSFTKSRSAGEVSGDFKFDSKDHLSLKFQWIPKRKLKGMEKADSFEPLQRRNELWKTTCFEAFIKPKNQKSYWEVNLSTHCLWNAYFFTDHRIPVQPVETKDLTLEKLLVNEGELVAVLKFDFHGMTEFDIGLSCVLEETGGVKSYWALKHNSDKPDFHDERGFRLARSLTDISEQGKK